MKKSKCRDRILTCIALSAFLVVLWLVDTGRLLGSYEARVIKLCGVYTIVALSLNLISGLTGQFSLGQAGFMAIGAYVTSLLIIPPPIKEAMFYVEPILPWVRDLQAPFLIALMAGGAIAALFASFIGFPVLRLKSDYLAIATLGFSEIIRIVIMNATPITNSSAGIKSIPPIANVWWTSISAGVCIFLVLRLMRTSYGRAFKAIRDDEVAAESMGISLFKHKMLSFVISAFLAGISGGLLASVVGVLTPVFFRFTLTYEILLIVVLGGQGSITGSLVAATVVTIAKEWLRFLDEGFSLGLFSVPAIPGLRMLVFSVFLMVIILFYREGFFGSREFSWEGFFGIFTKLGKWCKGLYRRGITPKGGDRA